MAPTPRSNNLPDDAGLHSEVAANRERGRRYFAVVDTVTGIKGHHGYIPEDHIPNAFCQDTTARTADDYCGLSSLELCRTKDMAHRRGKRHICQGQSRAMLAKTPSEPSLASEAISEESAMDHLGRREKIVDNRFKEMLEQVGEEEPMCGVASHHLHTRKRLGGFGKRHYGYVREGFHRSRCINDPGGENIYESTTRGFTGPRKGHAGNTDVFQENLLGTFSDVVLKERRSKRLFCDKIEEAVHASEDVPIGVSTQIDLHTRGFLGKSRHNFGGMMQLSSDPIIDRSSEPRDENDLSSYGLGHRGKRKYDVKTSLEAGCRHNMNAHPEGVSPRSMTSRSASAPSLPPNQTPYWQDDLPESERAKKKELVAACHTDKEMDRETRPRSANRPFDSSWSCMASWTPRKVDDRSATQFVEGEDLQQNHLLCDLTPEQHREYELRNTMGKTKRNFGNAHNKSDFRFDYCDSPEYKTEHIAIVKQHVWRDKEDENRKVDKTLMFGDGRGRRKFHVKDHLDKDDDGVECYRSSNGAVLGKVKHMIVKDHIDPVAGARDTEPPVIFLDPNGKSINPRNHKRVQDNVDELMNCEVQSEGSNTLGVAGIRRKTELLRPQSARRFPQKDFEKVTPRSLTPRAASQARIPITERPRWS